MVQFVGNNENVNLQISCLVNIYRP